MRTSVLRAGSAAAAVLLAAGVGGTALAAPGDIHQVQPERVNLRAGPSEQNNIRTTLVQGEEVIEIRREGDWVGVRSLRTGAEGWIYGNLLDQVAQSGLGGAGLGQAGGMGMQAQDMDMGFRQYSRGFDAMLGTLGRSIGVESLFERVGQGNDGALELVATDAFLRNAGRDVHALTALAVHQMLKNHQGGRPVAVRMLGADGNGYVDVSDLNGAAELAIRALGDAAQQAAR